MMMQMQVGLEGDQMVNSDVIILPLKVAYKREIVWCFLKKDEEAMIKKC